MNKNIISFSLYGNKNLYWKGAVKNIELAKKFYPNYICRFYIDINAPGKLKDLIVGNNVEKIFMRNRGGIDGMFWRFLPSTEPDVNIFLCRDADSRISEREKFAVDEWLASDKDFHIMRDNPRHNIPILGGMWGCRNQVLCHKGLDTKILNWPMRHFWGGDQKFLYSKVYPLVKDNCFEHSEYGICYENPIHPFPTPRINNEYVGEIVIV